MSIREQIIEICMKDFDDTVKSIHSYDDLTREIMPKGIPESMIIAEFKSCTRSLNKIKKGYNSKEFENVWRYKGGVLTPITLTKEPDEARPGKRDYYRETYARFAFSEEKRVLYLNIFYAPLSAEGWRYPLVDSEDGLKLGEPVLKWRS